MMARSFADEGTWGYARRPSSLLSAVTLGHTVSSPRHQDNLTIGGDVRVAPKLFLENIVCRGGPIDLEEYDTRQAFL